MPYSSIADLPPTFKNLPSGAKSIALAAVNNLLSKGESEESAIRQAWGAVKKSYKQEGDKWVKMEELEFTHKRIGSMVFPHSAFAYVPNRDQPAQWMFRLWENPEKKATKKQVSAAVVEYAEKKGSLPRVAIPKVRARLLAAWRKVNPGAGIPEVLTAFSEEDEPQVVDIEDVELFAIGTWKGKTFGESDLDAMVDAYTELPHMSRPVILGHDDAQPILAGSGLPAAGWVENLRRVGGKLVGDLKGVPSKVAALVKLGAFRKRSSEIYVNYTDTVTGKFFPLVFKALALLGAAIPEVKTIDDIYALYAEGETFAFEKGNLMAFDTRTLSEHGSYEFLLGQIQEALPEGWWVERTWPNMLLASASSQLGGNRKLFQVPWEFDVNGEIAVGLPVEVDREVFYTLTTRGTSSAPFEEDQNEGEDPIQEDDGGVEMSDEVRKQLRAILKLDEDASDEELLDAAKAAVEPEPEPEPAPEPEPEPEGEPEEEPAAEEEEMSADPVEVFKTSEEFTTLQAKAEAGEKATRKLFEMTRDSVIGKAVREGKVLPKDKPSWVERYEKDPATITAILSELPKKIDYEEKGEESDPGEDNTVDPAKVSAEADQYQTDHPGADREEAYMAVLKKYGEVE